ncbi:MAG: enoyl-CoA hydratase/isomerase family protein, partial [Myxococcales bacterium]|nr:enoyl-CoA hydratase/isomerase family protein [Myxococcales bacterium]
MVRPLWRSAVNLQDVTLENDGHLAIVTLNRPEARNAYTDGMIASLCEALRVADADTNVRCIIVTGAGKSFSAGGDLRLMADHKGMFEGEPMELRDRYRFGVQIVPKTIREIETPIVAAINGAAVGAGLDLACMCDIRIASTSARF